MDLDSVTDITDTDVVANMVTGTVTNTDTTTETNTDTDTNTVVVANTIFLDNFFHVCSMYVWKWILFVYSHD